MTTNTAVIKRSAQIIHIYTLNNTRDIILPCFTPLVTRNDSVYEKFQATRAKVAPGNLIYRSHFSATEAIHEVSQKRQKYGFLVESLYLQEVHVSQSTFM